MWVTVIWSYINNDLPKVDACAVFNAEKTFNFDLINSVCSNFSSHTSETKIVIPHYPPHRNCYWLWIVCLREMKTQISFRSLKINFVFSKRKSGTSKDVGLWSKWAGCVSGGLWRRMECVSRKSYEEQNRRNVAFNRGKRRARGHYYLRKRSQGVEYYVFIK